MLKRYFKKHDNPWEILAVALCFFGPGLALLLYSGPALLFKGNSRRAYLTSISLSEVHIFGWWAVTVAALLLAWYFYGRWTNTRERASTISMITVANCFNVQEALTLQMVLGAADIPSFIPDEATAQNAPYVFLGSEAGVRLQVAEEHASEARELISHSREILETPEIPEPYDDDNKAKEDKESQNEEEERC